MVRWILILCTLTGLLLEQCSGTPTCFLAPLYPYGTPRGDASDVGDDDNYELSLSSSIPYYGNTRDDVYVSTNGVIAFDDSEWGFISDGDASDIAHIASFWNDANLNEAGLVYYREVNLATEIDIACLVKRDAASIGLTLTPSLVFIVTWHEVASIEGGDPRTTHQIVVATNGTATIAVLNYGWVGWNFQSSLFGSSHAAVSFNKGDNSNFEEFSISRTASMIDIGSYSNVNFPGRIVVRVDGDITLPALSVADCSHCTADWSSGDVTGFDGSADLTMDVTSAKYLFAKQLQTTSEGEAISDLDHCKFMSRITTDNNGFLSWFSFSGGDHPSNPLKYKRSFTVNKGGADVVNYRGHGMSGSIEIVQFPHFETTYVDEDECLTFMVNKNSDRITISSPSCKYQINQDLSTDDVTLSLGDTYDDKTIGMCQNNNGDASDDKFTCNPPGDVSGEANYIDLIEADCRCQSYNNTCNAELQQV